MAKRVLVTGSSGLVCSRFIELCREKYDFITPDLPSFDMTDRAQVQNLFLKEKPDAVINFAAYTNVSEAEKQRGDKNGSCWKVNVEGTRNLLDAISSNCHFVQISTDMVFPGSKKFPGPYAEDAKPETDSSQVTWYGFTKWEAERLVREKQRSNATILRLIYPFRSHYGLKLDYVRKPLALFDERKLYPMFTDQQVSILFIDRMCPALSKIIDEKVFGTFHASSADTTTPFELISYVLEKVRGVKGAVKQSSLDEFLKTADNPVRYPKFGGLKVKKTEKELGVKFGTWREMVDGFAGQL